MPLEKTGNNQCLMYFYRLCLYSSPKTYSKSWWKLAYKELCLSWRRIHWKFHVNSKGMVFMPLEKTGNNQCLMYFYRLCIYSSPKTYSKSRWKLGYKELCLSWRRIHWKFHVNSKGMVFMPLEKTGNNQCLIYFYRLWLHFSPKMYSKSRWKLA